MGLMAEIWMYGLNWENGMNVGEKVTEVIGVIWVYGVNWEEGVNGVNVANGDKRDELGE